MKISELPAPCGADQIGNHIGFIGFCFRSIRRGVAHLNRAAIALEENPLDSIMTVGILAPDKWVEVDSDDVVLDPRLSLGVSRQSLQKFRGKSTCPLP